MVLLLFSSKQPFISGDNQAAGNKQSHSKVSAWERGGRQQHKFAGSSLQCRAETHSGFVRVLFVVEKRLAGVPPATQVHTMRRMHQSKAEGDRVDKHSPLARVHFGRSWKLEPNRVNRFRDRLRLTRALRLRLRLGVGVEFGHACGFGTFR